MLSATHILALAYLSQAQEIFPSLFNIPPSLILGDKLRLEIRLPATLASKLLAVESSARPAHAACIGTAIWGIPLPGHQVVADNASGLGGHRVYPWSISLRFTSGPTSGGTGKQTIAITASAKHKVITHHGIGFHPWLSTAHEWQIFLSSASSIINSKIHLQTLQRLWHSKNSAMHQLYLSTS
jgi:hypothetical protein